MCFDRGDGEFRHIGEESDAGDPFLVTVEEVDRHRGVESPSGGCSRAGSPRVRPVRLSGARLFGHTRTLRRARCRHRPCSSPRTSTDRRRIRRKPWECSHVKYEFVLSTHGVKEVITSGFRCDPEDFVVHDRGSVRPTEFFSVISIFVRC